MIQQNKHTIIFALSFTASLIFAINIFGQTSAQVSIPFEIYDNAGGQKILYFGLDQTATNGIDFLLGESDLPPYPPTGAFDARWLLPENGFNGSLSSWVDYRNAPGYPYSGTVEHRFRYQSMLNATAMYFNWNMPPEVTGLVQDLLNGTFINVPIEGHGTYQIINFETFNQLKFFVYYNNAVSDVENEVELPSEFLLEQNYPNPFNSNTVVSYQLPVGGNVLLKVFDVLGNEFATLVNEEKPAGTYEVKFDASSGNLNLVSGIYFYQLQTGNFIQTKKMILIK